MTSTAFVTIEERIASLKVAVEEAKKHGEFERAFELLDQIEQLESTERNA